MGNYMSAVRSNRKRTGSVASLDGETGDDENIRGRKRRRVKSSQHIYEALFVNGEGSDVCIYALGRTWNLHKVMLRQCGYFNSMFSGQWKETDENCIRIDIPDENIDEEALTITFGSLYQDEIEITRKNVVGVLAAATLFSLDDLITECINMMLENIVAETVCSYHTAGVQYGQPSLVHSCIGWLEKTLLPLQSAELLRSISVELMSALVSCSNLLVIQIEIDIYSMLRKWLFLKLCGTRWTGDNKELTRDADKFIKSKAAEWSATSEGCFLKLSEGSSYTDVFQRLRLNYIVSEYNSALMIENDHILPREWLFEAYRSQWLAMLRVDSGIDLGPKAVDEDVFLHQSYRCGRVLAATGDYCWRWTGFSFGFDLLISVNGRKITLKRNVATRRSHGAVSHQQFRCLMYRVTVSSPNQRSRPPFHQSTGIKLLTLRKDEDSEIMSIDESAVYPLHVSCNFLQHTPVAAAVNPGSPQ